MHAPFAANNSPVEHPDNSQSVLLVGGFGSSKYLHTRIESAAKIRQGGINVIQTRNPWVSVCKGATIWGLQHSERQLGCNVAPRVRSRVAQYSYGVRINTPFDFNLHWDQQADAEIDESGSLVMKDQMEWLIKRGDRLEQGNRVDHTIIERVAVQWYHRLTTSKQPFTHTLWYSHTDPPPRRFDSQLVGRLCEVSHKIRKGSLIHRAKDHPKGEFRDVEFTLGVEMSSASLDFFVAYTNGIEKARCTAQYKS